MINIFLVIFPQFFDGIARESVRAKKKISKARRLAKKGVEEKVNKNAFAHSSNCQNIQIYKGSVFSKINLISYGFSNNVKFAPPFAEKTKILQNMLCRGLTLQTLTRILAWLIDFRLWFLKKMIHVFSFNGILSENRENNCTTVWKNLRDTLSAQTPLPKEQFFCTRRKYTENKSCVKYSWQTRKGKNELTRPLSR